MQALVVREPGSFGVEDVPDPAPARGEVLVEVAATGICGSDLELLEGRRPAPYVRYPVVPGHEWSGRVVACGEDVTGLEVGDPVVAEGFRSCGVCARCGEGRTNLCQAPYAETGFTHPGALADRLTVPARLVHKLPTDRPVEPAALLEPAACVAAGFLEAGLPRPGERVAVVGPGPLGLLAVLMLRSVSPAELVLVGRRPARLARGRDCGATSVVNAADADALATVKGRFDVVVEATNSAEGMATALDLPRRGGTAILLGIAGSGRRTVDPDVFSLNQLRVQGIFGAPRAAWRWVVEMYGSGILDPSPLITHRLGLDELDRAVGLLKDPQGEAMKVLLSPGA
jgi:L-iditol 2-dehydrogenase